MSGVKVNSEGFKVAVGLVPRGACVAFGRGRSRGDTAIQARELVAQALLLALLVGRHEDEGLRLAAPHGIDQLAGAGTLGSSEGEFGLPLIQLDTQQIVIGLDLIGHETLAGLLAAAGKIVRGLDLQKVEEKKPEAKDDKAKGKDDKAKGKDEKKVKEDKKDKDDKKGKDEKKATDEKKAKDDKKS